MRRDADREERNARLLAGVVLAAMLVMLSGIIHLLYHREYAETDTPNDCFAVSAATGETALPKIVCLTFDDGPWPGTTNALLDGLAQRGVKATFFLVGEQVADRAETVRRMADEGHQIGLHTWHHVSLKGMTPDQITSQLDQTRAAIREIVGPVDLMLRPPYGFVDDTLRQWAKAPIICWSLDTEDWKDPTPSRITADILRQVKDGDIILMHDIFDTSVTAALAAVDQLLAQGYRLVTVEELFAQRGQDPQPGAVYCSLPPAQKEEVEP